MKGGPSPTELNQEILGRSLFHAEPEVLVLSDLTRDDVRLVKAGTVTCLVAPQGSELLREIAGAARERNFNLLRRYSDEMTGQMRTVLLGPGNRPTTLSDATVITEFRYSGRSLGWGMNTASGVQIATAQALYSGGALDHAKFQVACYVKSRVKYPQQAVILVNQPRLTTLEEAILKSVPSDRTEAFLSSSPEWVLDQLAGYAFGKALDWLLENGFQGHAPNVGNAGQQAMQMGMQMGMQGQQQNQDQQGGQGQANVQDQQQQDQQQQDQQQQDQQQQDQQQQDQQQVQQQGGRFIQTGGEFELDFEENLQEDGRDIFLDVGDDAAFDDAAAVGGFSQHFLRQLSRHDFSGLDPTASAQTLLQIRSKLLARNRDRWRGSLKPPRL
jgi:hypothetical protein